MKLFEISLQHIHTLNYISLSKVKISCIVWNYEYSSIFVRNVVRSPLATNGNQGQIGSSVHVHFAWRKNVWTLLKILKSRENYVQNFLLILRKCLCICSVIKIPQRSSAQCEVQILQPFLGHGNVSIQFKSKAYLLSLNYINIVFYQSKTYAVKKVNQTNFYLSISSPKQPYLSLSSYNSYILQTNLAQRIAGKG